MTLLREWLKSSTQSTGRCRLAGAVLCRYQSGHVTAEQREQIKRRGCAVIKAISPANKR